MVSIFDARRRNGRSTHEAISAHLEQIKVPFLRVSAQQYAEAVIERALDLRRLNFVNAVPKGFAGEDQRLTSSLIMKKS